VGPERQRFLLLDACVLIDFCQTETAVLRLVVDHVADVFVATTVLAEVRDFDEAAAVALGLRLVEPTLDQAFEAASRSGAVSFQDRICLALARDNGWTCVSNDKALRRACESAGIQVMWGLELVALLVEAGALTASAGREIGMAIRRVNRFITEEVLSRLLLRIGMGSQ